MTAALLLLGLALPVSIAGTNIAAALLSAFALLRLADPKPWRAVQNPGVYALIAYCAAGLACSALGVDPRHSFGVWFKDFHKLWLLTVLLLATSEEPAPPAVAAALAAGFALIGVVSVGQTTVHALTAHDWLRAHAFVHPVTFGEQVVIGLLGVAAFAARPPAGLASPRRWLAGLGALLAVALALNQTRAALAALVVGIAALALVEPKLRRTGALAVVAALALAALWQVLPVGGRTWSAAFSATANGQQTRYVLWRVAWQAFRDHPWTGVGPSNYGVVFPSYFHGLLEGQPIWGSAHNLYLHQLAERGLLGEAVLLAVLAVFVGRAARNVLRRPDAWRLWAFSAWTAFLVMNVTETAFQTEQVASLLIFLWACSETSSASSPRG